MKKGTKTVDKQMLHYLTEWELIENEQAERICKMMVEHMKSVESQVGFLPISDVTHMLAFGHYILQNSNQQNDGKTVMDYFQEYKANYS